MSPRDKIGAALRGLGILNFDLVYSLTQDGKPFDFRLTFRDHTFRGSCVRTVVRAAKRATLAACVGSIATPAARRPSPVQQPAASPAHA